MQVKECSKCKEIKSATKDNFRKHSEKDCFIAWCSPCEKEYKKNRKQGGYANREAYLSAQTKYRNSSKGQQTAKAYRLRK